MSRGADGGLRCLRGALPLSALDEVRCKLAAGQVRLALGGEVRLPVEQTMMLAVLPARLCTLRVNVTGGGSVVSIPVGIQ